MTEQDIPLDTLVNNARTMLPAVTMWPDRLIPIMYGEPAVAGTWRNIQIPETHVGWPLALHAGLKAGGSVHGMESLREVNRYAALMREVGVRVDLDFERVQAASRFIHGVVVPLQSIRRADIKENVFEDPMFSKFWCPFAQVWRFLEPVPFLAGQQAFHYLSNQERAPVIQAMCTAVRVH